MATIPTEQAPRRDQTADAARGAIVLSFVVALEIVIMISAFGLFFYKERAEITRTLYRGDRTYTVIDKMR